MKITEVKIGTKMELEVFDDFNEKITPSFASQLEWAVDENTAVVAAPIYGGVIYPIHKGWFMSVYFIYKDDLFKFRAKVLGRGSNDNLSYLKISIVNGIEKIQRREFFRFEFMVPVKYRVVESMSDDEQKGDLKPAATRDMSGGGVCIKLEDEVKLNSLVECILELSEKKKVHFYGIVVRSSKRNEDIKYKYEIGVLFKKIENRDKEAIIKFIFEQQRKLRKKGLI